MTDCMEERAPVAGGLLGPISAAAAAAADGNTSMIDHIRDVCSDDFYHQSIVDAKLPDIYRKCVYAL